jgi:hypothetical protein
MYRYYAFIPSLETGSLHWYLQGDPVQLVEARSLTWKAAIDEANKMFDF